MEKTGMRKSEKISDQFAAKGSPLAVLRARADTQRLLAAIRGVSDTAHGAIGQALFDRFRTTRCRVDIDETMAALAVHTSFVYPPRKGQPSFDNIIYLGAAVNAGRQAQFSALVHECAHAAQTGHTAALHASPFNAATPIALCPRDFVMACERAEQDAYARQAWFNDLMLAATGADPAITAKDPVPVATLRALRTAEGGATILALRRAALMMLDRPGFASASGDHVSLADSYHELALTAYRRILDARAKAGAPPLQFVRLADADILDIGRAAGPSLFGDGENLLPDFAQRPRLSPHNAALLAALNAELGIADEELLPTVGAALAARNMTRESFRQLGRRPIRGFPHPAP